MEAPGTPDQPEWDELGQEINGSDRPTSPAGKAFLVVAAVVIGVIALVVSVLLINLDKTTDTKTEAQETQDLTRIVVDVGKKIEDCSSQEGQCYKQNQENMRKAIQAILDGSKAQMDPHRLRNEAENLCLLYAFAGAPPNRIADRPIEDAVAQYKQCVLDNSGGTEPPPLPENPYNTTTTTTMRVRPVR